LMFLVFFLSRKGSFNALMMRLVALGSTSTSTPRESKGGKPLQLKKRDRLDVGA